MRPTDQESVSRVSPLTVKVSTTFEVNMTIRCLVTAFLLLIHYVTLWRCPTDLGQWSYMVGHIVNPSITQEASTAVFEL